MNFIAFSSQAKLLDRPHLDAAAAGQALLDAGVRLLLEHRAHVVFDKIYQAGAIDNPPAAGEWLRTPACRSEGAESTAAMATRGSRPIALGMYLWVRLDSSR